MFEFVRKIDGWLCNRVLDVLNVFKNRNISINVLTRVVFEVFIKRIDHSKYKKIYTQPKNRLGKLLSYKYVISALKRTLNCDIKFIYNYNHIAHSIKNGLARTKNISIDFTIDNSKVENVGDIINYNTETFRLNDVCPTYEMYLKRLIRFELFSRFCNAVKQLEFSYKI